MNKILSQSGSSLFFVAIGDSDGIFAEGWLVDLDTGEHGPLTLFRNVVALTPGADWKEFSGDELLANEVLSKIPQP